MSIKSAATSTGDKWSRRTWHRKATKPVTYWLVALIVAGLIHPILPEYRWVLIHLFTLGAVTNSIVVWSQHFTEKFLHQPIPETKRPQQLLKIRLLNGGIIITILGQLLSTSWQDHWILTCVGALIISIILLWHAASLASQFRTAKRGRPYASSVIAYIASSCFLPLGALAGGLMSMELPGTWQEQVLLAHTVANILGFLGLAALGSLAILYPAIWRTQLPFNATSWSVSLMIVGLIPIISGTLVNNGYLSASGLVIYLLGWLISIVAWGRASISVLKNPRDRVGFAAASVATAPLWLIGSLFYLGIQAVMHHDSLNHISLPTNALLIGFGAQLLIGVMSHLLPTTIGGGAAAVRTGSYATGRAGLFRWVLVNGGLAIWLLTDNSWLRVVASLLAIGALVAFIPLLATGIKAQRGVLQGTIKAAKPATQPHYGQITAGIAVLALVLAAFGGLNPATAPSTSTSNGDVLTIDISAGDMVFKPDVIEVPAGKTLEVTLSNDDDMVHDLKFANGSQTGRIKPGETITITVGVITENMDGWCTIAGHRAQGMELQVLVT